MYTLMIVFLTLGILLFFFGIQENLPKKLADHVAIVSFCLILISLWLAIYQHYQFTT